MTTTFEPLGEPRAFGEGPRDIAGIWIGHALQPGRATGCTVVLCPAGATGGVAVRGGAPGTRETDLLNPANTVEQVHGIVLSGGSAFGLDAASGVMRWLEAHGHGLPVGPAHVPIVPAAVLFDLWIGDGSIRPDADCGWRACEAAMADGVPAEREARAWGRVGAGRGATVGKLFGIGRAVCGGLGQATVRVGAHSVAVVVAVNPIGDVIDSDGRVIAGPREADGRIGPGTTALLLGAGIDSDLQQRPIARPAPGSATTIGIVATDAVLSKAQAQALAGLAHHGLSRAISPLTMYDGDTLFALATHAVEAPADLTALGAAAAEAVSIAIRRAVRAAEPMVREIDGLDVPACAG